jgi:hypothetical protein
VSLITSLHGFSPLPFILLPFFCPPKADRNIFHTEQSVYQSR